jgi:hypothetical protein
MKNHLIPLCAISIMFLSADASACGDSLYRVGKGVSYRTYSAPLPGNLLVYAQTDVAEQLAADLASSGHVVQLVTSIEEFEAELGSGHYDVIIAPYSERAVVEKTTMAQPLDEAAFLPVAMNKAEEREARQSYRSVLVADRGEIKQYLKEIHRALIAKG